MAGRDRARPLDWKAPDYRAVWAERRELLQKIRATNGWDGLVRYYQDDHPVDFIEDWLVTYDPRSINAGREAFAPFTLFPRQMEFVEALHEHFTGRRPFLVEKSRDMGVSWLCCAYALYLWLFIPGVAIGFGSQGLDDVDTLGNPKSLLEKIRIMVRKLPAELVPIGYTEREHARYMRIRNPETGAIIAGDGGEKIGRGDRTSIYFVDEAAFLEHPESVEGSLSNTTDVRVDVSTSNGMGNPFYRKKMSGAVDVFTFHWTSDPRKDQAWYDRQRATLDAETVAREIDLDYAATGGDLAIEVKWVLASQMLRRELEKSGELRAWLNQNDPDLVAGLDVGGGTAPSVFALRQGPLAFPTRDWMDGDTTNTAGKAIGLAREARAGTLKFDSVGVGKGVAATLVRAGEGVRCVPINVGDRPTNRTWPDRRTSRQKFINLRAETWWRVRERLRKTHEYWLHVQGQGGQAHDLAELLLLPEDPKLCGQLCLPRYEFTNTGKIAIERKPQMKSRGVLSPDHADALVLTFAPAPARARGGRAVGMS